MRCAVSLGICFIAGLLLLLFPITSGATSYRYVWSGGDNSTGVDWTHAYTAPRPAASWARDTVYYFATDDLTGVDITISAAADGTKGITLKKCKAGDSVCTAAAGWHASTMDNGPTQFAYLYITTDYVTLDGTSRTNNKTGHGFKLMGAGNSSYNVVDTDSAGGKTHITIQFCEITSTGTPYVEKHTAVYLFGTNHIVAYNYVHHLNGFLVMGGSGHSIHDNYFAYNRSWTGWHSGGMYVQYGDSDYAIYNNVWQDVEGSGIINLRSNSNVKIYNNVMFQSSNPEPRTDGDGITHPFGGTGMIQELATSGNSDAVLFYGNTISNIYRGQNGLVNTFNGSTRWTNFSVKNNIWWCDPAQIPNGESCSAVSYSQCAADTCHDYNWYSEGIKQAETHSQSETSSVCPFVDENGLSDWRLVSSSLARGRAVDLGSRYNIDILGISRPQGAAWDIGAYEYVQGGDTTPPAAPSGLTVN